MAANGKNTRINLDPNSFTISKPAATWGQWMRQKQRHTSTGKYYRASHKFLLGLYALSQFSFYPLLIASALLYRWDYSLLLFGVRFLVQTTVFGFSTRKLGEKDLFPWFPLFDLWMFVYYVIFLPALIRKPRNTWK
jgi:hypothetical protein